MASIYNILHGYLLEDSRNISFMTYLTVGRISNAKIPSLIIIIPYPVGIEQHWFQHQITSESQNINGLHG